MISVASATSGTTGLIRLNSDQSDDRFESVARISKTALLNGGSYIEHHGVTVTDRKPEITCRIKPSAFEKLRALHESGTSVRVATWEGCYVGYIYGMTVKKDGSARVVFYIKEKI
jgi:hypothetical protein